MTELVTDLFQAGEIKRSVKVVRGKKFIVKLLLNPSLPVYKIIQLCDYTGGEYDKDDHSITVLEVIKR